MLLSAWATLLFQGEMTMRSVSIFAVVLAACGLGAPVASAEGREYPWCARYDTWSYNCGFATWQQCQATISGAGGICQQNPRAAAFREPQPRQDKRKRALAHD
jgi:hypothetical protein